MSDMNTLETGKRGRKVGVKVQSLDFRADRALDEIDFEAFANRDDAGSRMWRRDLHDTVIAVLRANDIF